MFALLGVRVGLCRMDPGPVQLCGKTNRGREEGSSRGREESANRGREGPETGASFQLFLGVGQFFIYFSMPPDY